MKKILFNVIILATIFSGSSAWSQTYVDAGATGANDGSSWADAYTDLQQAIFDAQTGDKIWVAQGSYLPTIDETGALPASLRLRHFWLKDGVEVYGGFNGTELEMNQRNVQTQKAILEGQLDASNQAYHVINTTATSTARFDGFIVQNGNSTGGSAAGVSESGAGMLLLGDARFYNMEFRNNVGYSSGAGVYAVGSSTIFVSCRFEGNTTTLYDGAGLYIQNSTVTLYNCVLFNNTANRFGGAITAVNSTVNLQNASIANNTGVNVYQASTNATINNNQSTLWGNTSAIGIDSGGGSAVNFTECIYQWTATGSNINADPLFTNIATGDLRLSAGSPAIDGVSSSPYNPYRDIDGNQRIAGASLDQGAHEYNSVQGLILYVDKDATGANNGSSWTDAFTTLEAALAVGTFIENEEIWIAEGTYTPHATDRFAYWDLVSGVKIYGGFNATETLRGQRDPDTYVVTLSGDLNGDDNGNIDPSEATRQDNSYHLLRAYGQKSDMIIDGVTLSGANANGTGNELTAGVFISFHSGSDQLIQLSCNNVIIEKNTATSAAIYQNFHFATQGGTTIFNFSRSIIRENVGASIHGNMRYEGNRTYNQKNYGLIDNCLFYDNACNSASGASAIYNAVNNGNSVVCPMEVTNCTFTENTSGTGYVISVVRSNDSRYVNNIIYNNGSSTPIYWTNSGTPAFVFVNCISEDVNFGTNQDPLFRDAPNDDFRIACTGGSPAINGGTDLILPIAEFDFAGLTRTAEGTVDIGAHEFQAGIEIAATTTLACPGESVTLTATGGTGLSWTGGITNATPFVPTATTTYTASGTTVNNCLESEDITITVVSVNDYSVTTPTTSLCSSGTATVDLAGSETGIVYSLMEDGTSTVLDGPTPGTGGALTFNTGTLASTTTVNVTAQNITTTNYAYDFDGVNDYTALNSGDRGIAGNMTISAKIRVNATGASQWVAVKYSGSNGYILYVDPTGKAKFDGRDGAGGYKSSGAGTTTITDGQWHEITGVVSNTGWFIYVDGVLENSANYTPGGVLASGSNLNVGAHAGLFTPIDIDQLTIWNTAMNATGVQDILTTCYTGSESNIVGHFDFNETSGAIVIDYSSLALNGTIYGGYDPAVSSVDGSINGCTEMCETVMDLPITITIGDNVAPVADAATLSDVNSACAVTSLTAPTATDNCAGALTGTHNGSLPITSTTSITWTYDDGNGNTSTQTQNVVVNDNVAPVADVASLADITAQCDVSSLSTPTATDNCAGSISATHNATLPITASTLITWTYDDGNGNTSTQTQNVVINDNISPVADAASLPDLTNQCSIVTLVPPTATDNCAGAITGTSPISLPISTSTTITWTFDDGNGNTSTQTQNVIINDNTAPMPTIPSLAPLTSQCEITSLTAPSASDNCAGSISGTHNATLPITSNTTITWSYDDGNGNISSQTQNVVINDFTAPTADAATLSDIWEQCQLATLSAPTATDNCAGAITGTHNASLPITSTTTVTWTYDDGNGNTSTQDQIVWIDDYTDPVADQASLSDITAQCEVTSLSAPTATDNCAGALVGTHNVSLPISSSTTIIWTYDDGSGNSITQTQNVIINDNTAPVPDVGTLADITSQCALTSLTAPVATDNCFGTISGTHNATLPITSDMTITWTYTDGNGNSSTQTQEVYVNDAIAPTPDVATLPDVTAECSITSLSNPTATDNCSAVLVTSDAVLPIMSSTIVTWTYTDNSGNTATQTQNVVIDDITAPMADQATLADITDQCEVTTLTAPTATDNCVGAITGTHNATLPITATTVVTWSYDDGDGNISTQTQNVVINDNTAPVADVAALSDLTTACEITSLTAPTATDNCAGALTATPDVSTPITVSTLITWTYDDGNGNISTQTQNVVINDNVDPVPDVASLSDVNEPCEVTSLTAPTATDNCAGTITATHNALLPLIASALVTWTYDDGNGNIVTQDQQVNITDNTPPVPNVTNLPDITAACEVTTLTIPIATDNCLGNQIAGTHDATFPITSNTTVTWSYTDPSGNTSSQTQEVIITPVDANVSVSGITIIADNSTADSYQWIDCDNGNSAIAGETNQSFTPTANGNYAVQVTVGNCTETSACESISTIGLTENSVIALSLYPNPTFSNLNIVTEAHVSKVSIFDIAGKLVQEETEESFTVEQLAPGTYTIRINTDQGIVNQRFVKE